MPVVLEITLCILSIIGILVCTHILFCAVIICSKPVGTHLLHGQWRPGAHRAWLPNPKGTQTYEITLSSGCALLCHCAYNPDGGTWSSKPIHAQQEQFELRSKGKYTYTITIGEQFGHTDRLELTNMNGRTPITFSYRVLSEALSPACQTSSDWHDE
jgi:hypothetical protein